LDLERWKIRRIIETTVNRARAYASVNYISQAKISEYEVAEVGDAKTCAYCQHMDGQIMEVKNTVEALDTMTDKGVASVGEYMPFATTMKIEEFKQLGAADLQAAGFHTPAYHPHCRGRIVALI
jgi:hypothetical protein